jgi:hypothetical protein
MASFDEMKPLARANDVTWRLLGTSQGYGPDQLVVLRALASGDVDESLLDALDLDIKLQKERLGVKSDKDTE